MKNRRKACFSQRGGRADNLCISRCLTIRIEPVNQIENDMNNPEQATSEFKSKSGLKRIFSAFGYSMAGFKSAWRNEHAFRQELVVVAMATIVALLLPVAAWQKLLLIAVFVLVLIVELINSAIEAVVDRVSLERNPLSKNAKDFGSAAVLLTLMLAAATWLVILWPLFAGT